MRKRTTAIIAGAAVVAVALVVGLLLVKASLGDKEYNKYMEVGRKYYASMDYNQAIIAFKAASRVAPKEEDAYIELATIYMEQSNPSGAISTLKAAFDKTKSARVNLLLYKALHNTWAPDAGFIEDESGGNILPKDQFLDILSSYTFGQYSRYYGGHSELSNRSNGRYDFAYPDLGIVCSWYNTAEDANVIDSNNHVPYSDKLPNEIRLTDVGRIFDGFGGLVEYSRLEGLFDGNIVKSTVRIDGSDRETPVAIIKYRDLDITIETDREGNLKDAKGYNKIVPLAKSAAKDKGGGNVSGFVENAVTGDGVACEFTILQDGNIVEEIKAAANGSYEIYLAKGKYSAYFNFTGFMEETIDFTVGNADEKMNFTISPTLNTGEIRIVLEWGSIPLDLDSHLMTPYGERVWFRNFKAAHGGETIAELDLDDTTSYGPETTTIKNPAGIFMFSVQNFSGTGTFVGSEARVKVYLPGRPPVIFDDVPTNDGNWWHVFEVEDMNIRKINEVNDQSQE
jgi:tetratricopeptide (TPR) repeat protein